MKKCTIMIGPFSIFFTNVNRAMGIPGHSHYAEVTIVYDTISDIGFPSFEETHDVIQRELIKATHKVFRDCTNEDVADILFDAIDGIQHPDIAKWGGDYELRSVELAVRGVPDRIGHADSFTRYRVEKCTQ